MKLAKARTRPIPGTMNKTEELYQEHLRSLRDNGEILEFWWEGIKLKLANKTTYTPDFLVLTKELTLECHEVKGFWQDDARAKTKIAAAMYYPFIFKAFTPIAKGKGGGWLQEDF